jgi:hypothetical protein
VPVGVNTSVLTYLFREEDASGLFDPLRPAKKNPKSIKKLTEKRSRILVAAAGRSEAAARAYMSPPSQ